MNVANPYGTIQLSGRATWWAIAVLHVVVCVLPCAAAAQAAGPIVSEVRVEQEGRTLDDVAITSLIETDVGKPLDIHSVRESIDHLNSLNKYEDVQVFREDAPGGVRVRYVLIPSHPVDRIEFRGMVALPPDELRKAISDRFGVAAPPARRQDDVAAVLKQTYRDRGYPQAEVKPHIEETHNPERASMVFDIVSGPRASIAHLAVDQTDPTPANVVVGAPDVRVGQPYDADRIDRELARYADAMRERGFLEAHASHTVEFTPAGADVTLVVSRGPHVTIAFTGDPLPSGERDKLVPIRAEASVNEDILEDSQNAIVNYFRTRGYKDAAVTYQPVEQNDELTVTFDIQRGPRYIVDAVSVMGNAVMGSMEALDRLGLKKGEPFVQAALDRGAATVVNQYHNLGFTRAEVHSDITTLPNTRSQDVERHVAVEVTIAEGPRTIIKTLTLTGNMAISDAELRRTLTSLPGKPYSEVDVVSDRDRVELAYRNRGYENVVVDPRVAFSGNNTQADVTLAIREGQQIFVDHIIINGNKRTKRSTIERELTIKEGGPMGYSALIDSQQKLTALGLFRRVRLTEIQHGGDPTRDVLVDVEEAPPNTQAYGAGLEVGSRLFSSETGQAEERFEFVPRGSFEIGRRNMGGKNRSIDFFTRVALRSRDLVVANTGGVTLQPTTDNGFNEYRILTTYREPRIFDTRADLLLTATAEQAIRSSFTFQREEARAEVGTRLSEKYSVAGRYSFEKDRLLSDVIDPELQPVIDRFFPQVRLSKLSGTVIRGRQDVLDPAGGSAVSATTDVALRAIGSEVGFLKAYIEAFAYPQLPLHRRTVLALGGRLGLAHGFPRPVGDQLVEDLPASERFFAGGDTTVRGFSLDRVGTAETITPSGFPTGGNAVVILNAELRVSMPWSIQAVTFIDAGNVYTKASELDITDLRPAAGFGARIKLPLLSAPVRVDLGFNLHPRELVPGTLERRTVLHVSLGQAF